MITDKMIDRMLSDCRKIGDYAESRLKDAPDGTLTGRNVNGETRYYIINKSGDVKETYLGKGKAQAIREMEEKLYFSKLQQVCKRNEQTLLKIRKLSDTLQNPDAVFMQIPERKRHLIEPLDISRIPIPLKALKEWNRKNIKSKAPDCEKHYVTQNGEKVRSKSELIIADRLKAGGVPYYYESQLIMENEETSDLLYWYPDFKVLNTRNGKIYYWEHFGMLDDPEYCASCQYKLGTYAKCGYFPGENLIITSESRQHPLDTEYVDLMIEKYLK